MTDSASVPAIRASRRLYHIKSLSPKAEQAAILDAWGMPVTEIAREVGLSREHLSRIRYHPLYVARRRQAMEEEVLADIKSRLGVDRGQALGIQETARAELAAMLEATDPDGNPIYTVRLAAAKLIYEDKARTSAYQPEPGGGQVVAAAVVYAQVIVKTDGSTEIIEGKAEEEITDGHR